MNIVQKMSDNTKEYLDNFYRILDEMQNQMSSVQPSQSISETFIRQMIPHHEAAIKMSENILNFTTDTNVETLAKTIIADQTRDISKMQYMLEECAQVENSEIDISLYQREFKSILDNMVRKMNSAPATNNLNVDFLSEILPHHEGAINMSKTVLKFDICPELKKLAENIVINQASQVQQMQTLLRGKLN